MTPRLWSAALCGVLGFTIIAATAHNVSPLLADSQNARRGSAPLVLGHRGAPGYRPEHTLASYELAIDQGADFIEPDLVSTKDGVLVARHENEISGTTDVAEKFPDRRRTKTIDGVAVTGFFTEDLTLAEIKTLRAKERLAFRNQGWNGVYQVPTLQEVIDLAKRRSREGRLIGIYPETKHPTYFRSIGLALEAPLVRVLEANGYRGQRAPVFIQSFEVQNLKDLSRMTRLPLVQLLEVRTARPFDFVASGDPRTYGHLMTAAGLAEIATYAQGIGPNKRNIVPANPDGTLQAPTSLVNDAHRAKLVVHPYTFRNEPVFLAPDYQLDPIDEYIQFYRLGVDGLFSDAPDTAVRARKLAHERE
jgi:glycerophosphoryl diester phosphodiesterase